MTDITYAHGEIVPPREVPAPRREPLIGRTVRLEPLITDVHGDGLCAALTGPYGDPHQFDYMPYGPFADRDMFTSALCQFEVSLDPLWFTVIDGDSGNPLGLAAYLRIERINRVIEIGHLNFGPAMQRSTAATETIYLLIAHAFDLGYRRVEWKCDNLNERSKRAAIRFGFRAEGVFRKHMSVKGRNRDTAWFAIIDDDWPAIRDAYRRWLDPANFDAQGRQEQRLTMPGG